MRARGTYPPGPQSFSFGRTLQAARDPLPMLLSLYEEHGPIFSARLLHSPVIFMLGPEANHFITVAHPENFHWRESSFGDLIPLLGDGLLTIDDAYHDRAREIMMPAFHREQVAASVAAMVAEATPAIERLQLGKVVDVYEWMRGVAMRIAMRALLGLDPDEAGKGAAAAEHFERALGFYGTDFHLRLLRGPGSPWSKMVRSRAVLDEIVYGEIAQRRAAADESKMDILSLLVGVRDEAGEGFTDKEVRDQVMTLMFAGHDTSTSTLTFMMHELARHPDVVAKLCEEQDRVLGGEAPDIDRLEREMPYLDMVLDEVLRLYPPAWIGPAPRRPRLRIQRPPGRPRRLRQLLLLGQPPPARGLSRARGLHPRALQPRAQGGAAARRLRALRRRPADLHRQALRPDRGEAGGDDAAAAPAPRRDAGSLDDRAPDADALAPGRPRDAGAAAPVVSRPGCGRLSSPTPTSVPGRGATCFARSSSSNGWRRSSGHRRADLPRRPLRFPFRLGRRSGRCLRRAAAA